ncbi:hypothetical protein LJ657_16090 [Streptomyces sp. NR30]|uniref:DUF6801 domain-containing protein n=2 Tax=Streptomyces guryensis TaxID=2886947 RepID=A0A9Q3VJW3_9ACTN|nr:hypothetical protein [Streptomyces guryensis]
MNASVVWPAAHTQVVGRATPRLPVDTKAMGGADVTRALRFIGATTVEGTADVHAVVAAPGVRDIPVTVTLDVPRTAVPDSGPLTVPASGTIPSLTFRQPGPGKITIGAIDLHIVPRDANGDETIAHKVDASCGLSDGQDGVLATFEVVRPTTDPTASGTADTPGTPGKPRPSGTSGASGEPGAADPNASGSASASAAASSTVRAPSGSPGGTVSAWDSGASGTASPTSPDTSSAGGTGVSGPLRTVATVLGTSAAAAGIGWWVWRRRRTANREG